MCVCVLCVYHIDHVDQSLSMVGGNLKQLHMKNHVVINEMI